MTRPETIIIGKEEIEEIKLNMGSESDSEFVDCSNKTPEKESPTESDKPSALFPPQPKEPV